MSHERNEDELVAPEWLNAEYFTLVLRESEHDPEILVKSVNITPATFKGDHFASIIFRARLEYEERDNKKTKSIIIKIMPEDGQKNMLFKKTHLFETEIGIYKDVIPKLESVLKAAGDELELAPRCLYADLDPHKILIFEDLVSFGYDLVRNRTIEINEMKLACRQLAKWHAVSLKLTKETPDIFNKFRYGTLSIDNPEMHDFMYSGMDSFINMLSETPSLQQYEPLFRKIRPKFYDTCKSYFREYFENQQKHKQYVLCHGDFHLGNMMFREKPFDVKLLDFQTCFMGPHVMDILYAMITLLPPLNLTKYRDEVIYSYFIDFVKSLKLIKFVGRIPKFSEFREQLIEHRFFELYLVVTFLPISFAFMDGVDISQVFVSQESRNVMYRVKLFHKELETLLPYYLHLGYFEE